MSSVTLPQWFGDNDGSQPYRVISGKDDYIWWLEYLPDGRRAVTGSYSGTVRIWDLESGEEEGTSMEHESEISGLAVTRDGTKIISSGCSGKITVWDVELHERAREWTYPEAYCKIAISPDDRLVAVGDMSVGIHTMEGKLVSSIEVGDTILAMCFSPDGHKLACGTRNAIRVYDVSNGALLLGPLDRHWLSDVRWSRDGNRLFSGSEDKTIRCWDSDTGEQIGHPWTCHTNHMRTLSLSPDGSILASASLDRTIRFWNATTGNPIRQPLQHDKGVSAVCFSPSGEFVASAGGVRKIYLWRVPWLNLNTVSHQVIYSNIRVCPNTSTHRSLFAISATHNFA